MMKVKLVNLTDHVITLVDQSGRKCNIDPEGSVARVDIEREFITNIEVEKGFLVPVYQIGWGKVYELPAPEPGTRYIVSSLLADANPDRDDLLVPDMVQFGPEGKFAKALRINGVS